MIKGIHHVALKCKDKESFLKTVSFYKEVLGLEPVRQWGDNDGVPTGIMLSTGAGLMEIFSNAEDELPQGVIRHFALACDDVDGCVEAVRAAGYAVTVEPKDIVIPSEIPFPARIAFVIGACGEEIELFCEK